ncbi:MAG: extracellular solute-binding protein [Mycetocola sp.]
MHRRLTVAIAAFALAALAACGGGGEAEDVEGGTQSGPQTLIDAAKKEGELTWYGGSTEKGLQATAKKFEATYGIKVNVVRLISAQIAQRFAGEAESGKVVADVISTVDPNFFADQRKSGNLLDLTTREVPEVSSFPAEYVQKDGSSFVFGISTYTVPWNTGTMGDDFSISSWDDLVSAATKGEILLVDPRKSAAWAQVWSGILNDPALGPDYIKKFAAQKYRQVVDGGLLGAQLVAAGEGGVLFASTPSTIAPLVEEGAPIKEWEMSSPAPVGYQFMNVTAKAPHPNAARLFANWLMTEEGQSVYSKAEANISPLGDIEGAREPLPNMIAPEADQATKDLPQVLDLLGIE